MCIFKLVPMKLATQGQTSLVPTPGDEADHLYIPLYYKSWYQCSYLPASVQFLPWTLVVL